MHTFDLRLRLNNGLLVLLKEIHTAPLISHWIWYRVGSRNELPGKTGASHWVEHMLFKGTPNFPPGVLDRAISRLGGVWNAFTFLDWTAYFETLPAGNIDLALRLEADRMVNSEFAPAEFEAERNVILSERQGNENDPTFLLAEAVQAQAFQVHPYRHEVIGEQDDLRRMGHAELLQHYRTYYTPGNAVLGIAGDFDSNQMLDRIRELFEAIPAIHLPAEHINPEPTQAEPRYVEVHGPGETLFLQVSFHAPPAQHPDFLPLNVLDSLLSGASDLSIFGGRLSNKTSQLYQTLVETELVVSIHGSLPVTIDPYLHTFLAVLHPNAVPEQVLEALNKQIRIVQETPPSHEALKRAIKQARALFAYSTESITNQAAWLGLVEMFADQEWLGSHLERLETVTPEDIQRVAQTYLCPENSVVGVYLPERGG